MSRKKILKSLLFPNAVIRVALVPISTVFLVYSMVFIGTKSPAAIASYVFSAYTLTVWCVLIPRLLSFFKGRRDNNKFIKRWLNDTDLRVKTSLYSSLIWNTAYAAFQLGLGFVHSSFWFFSMAAYYALLAVMRFVLVKYVSKHNLGEHQREELVLYRACGWVFLAMNLALSLMVFFMVYWNRTFYHHEITAIIMAAYTFTAFTLAIINLIKYRKYNSPVSIASKAISLAAACVSMLTLETTMLTTFNDGTMSLSTRRIFLGTTGAVISIFIIVMSVYIIRQSNKKIKELNNQV